MAVEAAERLLAEHGPEGWTDVRVAAAEYRYATETGEGEDKSVWYVLSSGEQALIRLALSLWDAPGVTCSLYRDLGALDSTLLAAVVEAIAEACSLTTRPANVDGDGFTWHSNLPA